jgi:hypothetical protein
MESKELVKILLQKQGGAVRLSLVRDGFLLFALLQAEQAGVHAPVQRQQLLVRAALAHPPCLDPGAYTRQLLSST